MISILQFRYLIMSKFTSLKTGKSLDPSLVVVPLALVLGSYVLYESKIIKHFDYTLIFIIHINKFIIYIIKLLLNI